MRLLRPVLALLLLLSLTAYGRTQDNPPKDDPAKKFKLPPLRISKIRVGFQPYEKSGSAYYKPGFWTPVRVQLLAGEKEIRDGQLLLGTNDSEDVNTTTRTLFNLDATTSAEEMTRNTRTIVSYVMPGNWSANVNVSARALDRIFPAEGPIDGTPGEQGKLKLTAQLYLTLPNRIRTLRDTLLSLRRAEVPNENANFLMPEDTEETSTFPRFAAFENDPEILPGMWKGYQGVDIIILTTEDRKFLESLMRPSDLGRLEAIAQWVRLGGRLIISVSADKQDTVSRLLQSSAWKPPLPVKLPEDSGDILANAPTQLKGIEDWARVHDNIPFKGRGANGKVPIAQLENPKGPAPDWEVIRRVSKDDPRPVLTRVAYGRGQIIFVAFELDDQAPFSQWEGGPQNSRVKGCEKFWARLIETVAPRLAPAEKASRPENDLASTLHRTLDIFNVKIVPFGWVALFIFIYILVVGPLDYLLLKYVFKRLELTWITFPAVVFVVSFAAYFTAYAIKGKELRINQIDLLDFDLRTNFDNSDPKAKPYVYGQTFFTVLSPNIHNYTIGLEPNPAFWGRAEPKPRSADMLTWLGRGGSDDSAGVNRRGQQSLIRRPYSYAGDVATLEKVGLEGVLIPVWTTKAFTATWNAELPQMPFKADLTYHEGKEGKLVTGKLLSNLEVDLEDCWLIYSNMAYPLNKPLKGKKAAELEVTLSSNSARMDFFAWAGEPDRGDSERQASSDQGFYNPTGTMKKILFYEKADPRINLHNQLLRHLDYSWRMREEDEKLGGVREAVLYARVRFRAGEIDKLCEDAGNPLPTHIWLGDLPGRNQNKRPPLSGGTMNQDTYVRVLLPVRPAGS